jgi:hypothetical protein
MALYASRQDVRVFPRLRQPQPSQQDAVARIAVQLAISFVASLGVARNERLEKHAGLDLLPNRGVPEIAAAQLVLSRGRLWLRVTGAAKRT